MNLVFPESETLKSKTARMKDLLYHYSFRVDRVIDGDTIEGKLDKGKKNFDEEVVIRLLGIQAPETRTKDLREKELGLIAKEFLTNLILNKVVIIKTHKADDDDNFGRMLGEVYLPTEEEDIYINKYMIETGHAVPYMK